MIMGSFRLREPGDRDYAKRRRQMTRQINTFTTRAQHNGDLGYLAVEVPGWRGNEAWNGAILWHGADKVLLISVPEQIVGAHRDTFLPCVRLGSP